MIQVFSLLSFHLLRKSRLWKDDRVTETRSKERKSSELKFWILFSKVDDAKGSEDIRGGQDSSELQDGIWKAKATYFGAF